MPTSNAARFDELENKLDTLLEMHSTTNALITTLVTRVDSIEQKFESVSGDLHDQAIRIDNHQELIAKLQKNLDHAMEHIDTLENRQREKNLKLLAVAENLEDNSGLIPFLIQLLEIEWGIKLKSTDLEKAHRLGRLDKASRNPRPIIFSVSNFQTKLQILKDGTKRWANGREPSKYRIVPDISQQLRKKRDAFWPLREQLHKLNYYYYESEVPGDATGSGW